MDAPTTPGSGPGAIDPMPAVESDRAPGPVPDPARDPTPVVESDRALDTVAPASARELLPYAILTGLCGLLPVPIVDDFAASLARAAMLRRVAHRHDLKLDRFAQRLLVRASFPIGGAPGQIALSALRVAFRKVFLVVNVGLRADDALATFVLGHLFDRYCCEQHRRDVDGEWVTESRAGQIRAAVDGSLRGAGSAVLREVFARALGSGWEWLRSVPGAVMTFVGSVVRRDEKGGEESVEELLREEKGFFGRVADLAAEGIGTVGDDYFRSVEKAFDRSMGYGGRTSAAPGTGGAA